MGYYEEEIIINASPERVHEITKDAVKVLNRVPGYNVTVLKQDGDKIFFQAVAHYFKFWHPSWQTWVDVSDPGSVQFMQYKGPVQGLKSAWECTAVPEGTKFVIVHEFEGRIPVVRIKPPIFHKALEKWIYARCIDGVANGILKDIKSMAEGTNGD